ncbi:MAG: Pseudaminic acid cytidylyltransferase [Burkholderiaceae bacterium]|jgi:UDP-2,4-diacetamido-2,4,6-trideoxy-beta-L-altropyranose hydrolase|nr:MAG: Pseudaminic acid cytidylyltransferase [Burkholderiaceae bacterium]
MKVALRTDASLQIGSGHVMRCLTLADALKARGADCQFISREHPGHLMEVVRQRGYKVNRLAAGVPHGKNAIKSVAKQVRDAQPEPAHAAWLGSTWQADAQETAAILVDLQPDWLVVDHYALDERWERALRPDCGRVFVIDDLADRPHDCDLLLDQNLGRSPEHYARLVPRDCTVLAGPRYALLRPEFARLRDYSLQRRRHGKLQHLLITMGGVDADNATGCVLEALGACKLPSGCCITVVMGAAAPWLGQVRGQAARMVVPTEVVVDVDDMAQRMADSDLAIGAAGGTAWERCCLGLPSLVVVLAANQRPGALALGQAGAAVLLDDDLINRQPGIAALQEALRNTDRLWATSLAARQLADGLGALRVIDHVCAATEPSRLS